MESEFGLKVFISECKTPFEGKNLELEIFISREGCWELANGLLHASLSIAPKISVMFLNGTRHMQKAQFSHIDIYLLGTHSVQGIVIFYGAIETNKIISLVQINKKNSYLSKQGEKGFCYYYYF